MAGERRIWLHCGQVLGDAVNAVEGGAGAREVNSGRGCTHWRHRQTGCKEGVVESCRGLLEAEGASAAVRGRAAVDRRSGLKANGALPMSVAGAVTSA
jgi:hypothetical protein